MTGSTQRQAQLDALWSFFVGVVASIALITALGATAQPTLIAMLGVSGGLALMAGLNLSGRHRVLLLLVAGSALGGWRGLAQTQQHHALQEILEHPSPVAIRVTTTVLEGWSPSRWGQTTTVRVTEARHTSRIVDLPRRCRLEVRTSVPGVPLPEPGATVQALVSVKGTTDSPLLVCASPDLLKVSELPGGTPAIRQYLAATLIKAATTDAGRIRSAELAAALALGRRDLVPAHRRQGWRASGLGHALAVSGLHVGIVSATFWLVGVLVGFQPKTIRWLLLVAVPGYTILAGAAPSAVRACLMVCLYLIARQLGRTAVPLGAVMTAASIMLLIDPSLIFNPGFQLTVAVTATLVRWAPPLANWLRGPQWFRGAVAIPVIAQLAAGPIVAVHFRTAIPLAAVVNLAVPVLLTPTIPLAVGAVILAPLSPVASGWLLDLIGILSHALWVVGELGRHWTLIVPSFHQIILILLAIVGLIALRLDRAGRAAAITWLALILISPAYWVFGNGIAEDRVTLLPVGDGLAATLTTEGRTHLFDGGRYRSEAAELLTDAGISHLATVIVSHGDEDHAGGILRVLTSIHTDRMLLPAWLMSDPQIVPILRAARRAGTSISPVVRGSLVHSGQARLHVLWPPANRNSLTNNDSSMVLRARTPSGSIVLTGDIGASVERRLIRTSHLEADILLVPHHGSASSSSDRLLQAVSPLLALIPAGPNNRHNHPHPTVLARLTAHNIPFVFPARDGLCGAVSTDDNSWQTYTMQP